MAPMDSNFQMIIYFHCIFFLSFCLFPMLYFLPCLWTHYLPLHLLSHHICPISCLGQRLHHPHCLPLPRRRCMPLPPSSLSATSSIIDVCHLIPPHHSPPLLLCAFRCFLHTIACHFLHTIACHLIPPQGCLPLPHIAVCHFLHIAICHFLHIAVCSYFPVLSRVNVEQSAIK